MLETNKIRQLIEMMVNNDLVELSLRDGDVEVSLRRPNNSACVDGQVVTVSPAGAAEESSGETSAVLNKTT